MSSHMRREKDLTPDDIALIKGMAARKDRQVDIAYWMGVPQTVVWRILQDADKPDSLRKKYGHIEPAPLERLPEKGPYRIVSQETFAKLTDAAAVPVSLIGELMQRIDTLQLSIDTLRTNISEGERDARQPPQSA